LWSSPFLKNRTKKRRKEERKRDAAVQRLYE